MNFQKARQPFVVQNGVLAESSRIFALAIGSLVFLRDRAKGHRARESYPPPPLPLFDPVFFGADETVVYTLEI